MTHKAENATKTKPPMPAENLDEAKRLYMDGGRGVGICASDFLALCEKHGISVGGATRAHIEADVFRISTNSVATTNKVRGVSASRVMKALTERLAGIVPSGSLRLRVDMIPKALHGRNLRLVLGKARWSTLRREILADRAHVCEVCGMHADDTSQLHAHEVWQYDLTKKPNRATLKRIGLLCPLCHAVEHLGNTQARIQEGTLPTSYFDTLAMHFCKVNDVGEAMWELHVEQAWKDWKALSRRSAWQVEFGEYEHLIGAGERDI